MFFLPILSFLIFLPIVAILVILGVKGDSNNKIKSIKSIGVVTSFLHLMLTVYLAYWFDKVSIDYQFTESFSLLPMFDFSYSIGLDGISLIFFLISSLLCLLVLTFSKVSESNVKLFTISVLIILSSSIATFLATDLLLFYIFFEVSVIPVFFIIGKMGVKDKNYAAFKFLLYTIMGSMFMLISIIVILINAHTLNLNTLINFNFPEKIQLFLFIGMFIGLGVKSAVFPFHTWLPDTYESSPYGLNILLSGVMMKYGIYGMIRFLLPMFPYAVMQLSNYIYILAFLGMFFATFIAIKQVDFKRFFGYFSIAHVSLIVAGIFSLNVHAIEGALVQSFAHSIYNAGIFFVLMFLQQRYNSSSIGEFSGMVSFMPKLSFYFMICAIASIGVPLTVSFVGEFLILLGLFENNRIVAIFFALSLIFSAVVVMYFNKKVLFGKPSISSVSDINHKEMLVLSIIVVILIFVGIYPNLILDIVHTSVAKVVDHIKTIII